MKWFPVCVFLVLHHVAHGSIRKRQIEDEPIADEQTLERELCKDKGPGEWFRLNVGGNHKCRDVIQCTSAGLQAIRCPSGLSFDVEKQTCAWKNEVDNCDVKTRKKKIQPLLYTDEPLCSNSNDLACGDKTCIDKGLFCNNREDCADGSDETQCDIDNDPNAAPFCDPDVCTLDQGCWCSVDGTQIPDNIPRKHIPQMVMLSFDDAINNNNIDLYQYMFEEVGFENPNGCSIKGTFFVSHKYTNYSAVQHMHKLGHEIAAHSISHRNDEKFWTEASIEEWRQEMAGSRDIITRFANITDGSVLGIRAPYLRVGGNNQFNMMMQEGFYYDSTITAPLSDPPYWPYHLNFRMPHRCHGYSQLCPTRSFQIWEMVMNELDRREIGDNDFLPGCAMIDSCNNLENKDQIANFLNINFDRYYNSNRAPLGLFLHAAWLKNNPDILEGFLTWIYDILETHDDVYFVTMTQVIDWISNPTTLDQIQEFEPWLTKCNPDPLKIEKCLSQTCTMSSKELPGETLRMDTCMRCPNSYPWVRDSDGNGIY